MAEEVKKATLSRVEGLDEHTFGIPVFAATSDGELPDEVYQAPMLYVLTGNGPLLVKNGAIFSSVSKVDEFIGLGEVPEKLLYRFKPIPEEIVKQVIGFFKWAGWDEAMVLPYYNTETEEWAVIVPEQSVTSGSIDYKITEEVQKEIPEGFIRLGSWHSHGSGSAYHSSVDHHDEEEDDGIHITFGGFSKIQKDVSSSVSLMADGVRWTLESGKAFDLSEGLVKVSQTSQSVTGHAQWKTFKPAEKKEYLEYEDGYEFDFPEEWKDRVKKVVVKTTSAYSHGTSYGSYDDYWVHGRGSTGSGSDKPPTPNTVPLCKEVGGCKHCKSAISMLTAVNVYMGKSNLLTKQHDYTTPEGRANAFEDLFDNEIGPKGNAAYRDYDITLTDEEIELFSQSVDELMEVVADEDIPISKFPRYTEGDPEYICGDPRSQMFGKPLAGIFFCMRNRPKTWGESHKIRDLQTGYIDFSKSAEYQEYANTNGNSFYAKLRMGYNTCSDCADFKYGVGCMNESSPYYGLEESPTGCDDLAEEMNGWPICIQFTDAIVYDDENEQEMEDKSCMFCRSFETDLHGVECTCSQTGESVSYLESCSKFEEDPNNYRNRNKHAAGSGDVATASMPCYTCENRVVVDDRDECLIYQDRFARESRNCGFYVREGFIGSEDRERESER